MANAFEGFEERVEKAVADLENALVNDNCDDDEHGGAVQKGIQETNKAQFKTFNDIFKQTFSERLMKNNNSNNNNNNNNHNHNSSTAKSPSNRGSLSDFDSSESSYRRFHFSINPHERPVNMIRLHSLHSFVDLNTRGDTDNNHLHQVPYPEVMDPKIFRLQIPKRRANNLSEDFLKANPEYPRCSTRRKVANAPGLLKFYRNRPFSVDVLRSKVQNMFVRSPEASGWVATTPNCSPQVRYDQYKKFWEKFPVPGEKPRRELRWSIRNEMAKRDELQKQSWWPEVKLSPTS